MGGNGEKSVNLIEEKALNSKTLEIEHKKPSLSSKRKPPVKKLAGAIKASTQWAREWDTGKDPVDQWKMNVPDLGDTTVQASNYFRSSFNPRGLARFRGGNGTNRNPRQQRKPVGNPGFFHDDRFYDVEEESTKKDGEKASNITNQLPEAVRDKKIACRLSVVDRRQTSAGKQVKKFSPALQKLSHAHTNNAKYDGKPMESPEKLNNQTKNPNYLNEKGIKGQQNRNARPRRDNLGANKLELVSSRKQEKGPTKDVKEANKAVRPAYAPAHWNRRRDANKTGHSKFNQSEIKRLLEQLVDKVSIDIADMQLTMKEQTKAENKTTSVEKIDSVEK